MTNQQGAPEALRPIARYKIGYTTDDWGMRSSTPSGIPDHAGAWVRYEDHVAALVEAQQPAPSAVVALSDDLRDRLVAISEAIADQDDRAAQAMLREILAAPQPSPTPQADSQPAPVRDYPLLPEPDLGMPWRVNAKSDGAAHSSGFTYEQMRAYVDADRAARAPADSVTAPTGGAVGDDYEQLQRTAIGWQQRAEFAERNWEKCYRVALIHGADHSDFENKPGAHWFAPTQPTQAADSVQDLQPVHDAVTIDLLNERVAYLERKLKEADSVREDAARYRWLREKPGADLRYGAEQYTRVCAVCQNYGADLDAAIDAARKQGGSA